MRWQFGGNLQPVRMICEFDWRECPSAVINYVWTEIVTDVVDCLTNESMIWRVIAMLFVCTLLVHTIYSKARWMDETTINRENLNIVGCKVQDLELKVNILTYKMQYGTWPLPRQIQDTGIEAGLRNVRLTLTNSSDRNAWLKHMLLSPAENAACLPYAKIGPRSVRCLTKLLNLETKYMSSRFSRDASPASNKVKSSRSSSEKSIKYEGVSKKSLDVVKTDAKSMYNSESIGIRMDDCTDSFRKDTNNSWSETQVLKYRERPKIFSRLQRSCENDLNVTKKLSSSTRKSDDVNNYYEKRGSSAQVINRREHPKSFSRQQSSSEIDFDKFPLVARKSELIDKSPEERVNSTQETLQQVTQKLENLHSVLRIYGSPDCATSTRDEACSNKELAESILQDLKNLGNLPTESESDGKTSGIVLQLLDSNTEESQDAKEEEDSASEFEPCQSDRNSSSVRSNENSLDVQCNDFPEPTDSKNLIKESVAIEKNVEDCHEDRTMIDRAKNHLQNISRDSSPVKTLSPSKTSTVESSDEEPLESAPLDTEEGLLQSSLTPSQAELSKDSDLDEKSNATLLLEALKFKKALLSRIELEKEQKIAEDHREQKSEESEVESDEQWPNVKNYFQSKLLDIISEEQSASSSTEKNSKLPTLSKPSPQSKEPENELKYSIEATINNPESSELALVSESSEYFSLSNLEEKMLAQNVVSFTAKDAVESSSDFTEDEVSETNERAVEEKDNILQKNISDLVNQSVQNIREYIEVFSKMQDEAILETKQAIINENSKNSSNILKDCSSDDSIMHFVNTVAIVDSLSEELPRELPDPVANSLVDLDAELSEEESQGNSDYKPDFALKRRPGSISLTEQNSTEENQELQCETLDSRSIFESAQSETEDDYSRINDVEIVSSEPSCKELVMDYLLESDSDFTDEKLPDTLNLIQFEEEMELREKEGERRTLDSPLTGRTVIQATSSLTSNVETESSSVDFSDNAEFEETENSVNLEHEKKFSRDEIVQNQEIIDCEDLAELSMTRIVESGSVYLTDEVSISESKYRESSPRIVDDSIKNLSESNTWILEMPELDELENKQRKIKENVATEGSDSAINESPTKSTEFIENSTEQSENCPKRPKSGDTVVIKKSQDNSIGNEEISSKINLSSDTSGTYMDANSRDFSNSSGITNLVFDKSILNPHNKIDAASLSKSARGSSSSPLHQQISWNAPKRGSSLNNATSTRSKKPEKVKSKSENLQIVKTKSLGSKPTRFQSSEEKQLKAKSNFNINGTKELKSSISTPGQCAGKIKVNLPERRSRSYATPRKNEASPRTSATLQLVDTQRISRTSKESETSKTNLEKSGNSNQSVDLKKYEKPKNWKKLEKLNFSENFDKTTLQLSARGSSRSCATKPSSKSCIPVLRNKIRAKSPMRGPLTISSSSWREETLGTSNSPLENIQAEGSIAQNERNSCIIQCPEPYEILEKNDVKSCEKLPDNRTVIYVNIVTEQEHSATRVVDPKKFLEYLKDRELKVQSVFNHEIGIEDPLASTAAPGSCSSPRILTVVSSAVDGKVSSDNLPQCSNNSALTGSWSLRVEQKEIEVSAKPSVIDTSTSISDLPEISTEAQANLEKFQIFEVPKELTKDEYIVLLEALNQDPNLHQLREMHKLCNKLGLGFHE